MAGLINIVWCSVGWFFLLIIFAGGLKALGLFLALSVIGLWSYFTFFGGRERVDKAYAKLQDTLMEGEGLISKGVDCRPFALFSRRQVFGITNSRVIRLERGLLGGFKMKDFQWKDLKDAQVSEYVLPSFCGSSLSFRAQFMKIEVHPSVDVATEMYKVAQKEEQAWEEKRRVREMEETRAAAGGVMFAGGGIPSQAPAPQATQSSESLSNSVADELIKLKKLVDQGVISDVEFNEMKSKLLSKGTQNF
jgi:hypothetical protein